MVSIFKAVATVKARCVVTIELRTRNL